MGDLPLEGYRVIDFGWAAAAPRATCLLADMGAEVIKVETRKRLDPVRFGPDNIERDPEKDPLFHSINRNKLGILLNLTTPEGKTIRYRYGATYKRPDGVILYDNDLCVGCGKCIDACPYGARNWNKQLLSGKDNTKNGIVKCDFCTHRI